MNADLGVRLEKSRGGKYSYEYWRAVWVDQDGRERSKNLGRTSVLSKRAAIGFCRELEGDHRVSPTRRAGGKAPTLLEWTHRYMELRTDLSDSTRDLHETTIKYLLEFYHHEVRLDAISRARATDFRAWLGKQRRTYARVREDREPPESYPLGTATVRKHIRNCKVIFGMAVEQDVLTFNPFDRENGTAPEPDKDWRYVTDAEMGKVLAACPDQDWRHAFALCRWAGLRIAEATHLTWDRIDLEGRSLTVVTRRGMTTTKERRRVVPIQPALHAVLAAATKREGAAVCTLPGSPYNDVDKVLEAAGLKPWPKPFHTLRKNLATDWQAKYPPLDVAAWLGHDVTVAAKHYHQTRPEAMAAVTGGRDELAAARAEIDALKRQLAERPTSSPTPRD